MFIAVITLTVKWLTFMSIVSSEKEAAESNQKVLIAQTARKAYEGTLRYGMKRSCCSIEVEADVV